MPRKLKSQDGNPYEIIRGMWEGAYVSHFVRLFRKKFGFSCISTQDLEEALIVEESVVLADVFARLLRYLTGNKNILIENVHVFLRNLLIKEKAEVPHYLDNGTTWQDLTPEEKLGTLKWLIDHVHKEKEEDFADFLDENYNADDLRGICAGQDAFNNVYWYLDDLRLYRELSVKKQNKKEWECVCLTLSDWQSFLKQFRKTTNLQEKELYTYLNFQLFPIIEVELLDKSKEKVIDKEAESIFLIDREREELEDMLEKKILDCNNGVIKSIDVNGTDNICSEKQNGSIVAVKNDNGNVLTEFKVKTEENRTTINMNHCDGHLNTTESVSSVSNSISVSKMDITSGVTDVCVKVEACTSSCQTTSASSTQDSCNVTTSESTDSCVNDSLCSTTSSLPTTIPCSRDNAQDVNIQQPLSDNPSDSSSVTSNKENAPPSSGNSGTDVPPMSAMSNMVGSTTAPATTASVQPLPSNMVNKTSFPIETQYMQQQSQIFVFSTSLANKAAESYLSGQFTSIIAYHCAQPGTKSFLEKYPLKVQQFNRQNPAAWLNTLAQMKQGRPIKGSINQFPGPHTMNNRFPGPSSASVITPCTGPCNIHGPNMCGGSRMQGPWTHGMSANNMGTGLPSDMCGHGNLQSWNTQQFGSNIPSSMTPRFPNAIPQGINLRHVGPGSSMMGCLNNMSGNVGNAFHIGANLSTGPGGPSTLTGVKVPDENLTPQQRQHREEQLAMIRKMQQLLFPEQQHLEQVQGGMMSPQQNMGPVAGAMLSHGSQPRFGPGDMCMHPGMDVCYSPHPPCMGEHEHSHPSSDIFMGPNTMTPGFHQQTFPPISVAAQLEWQKLQNQFFEDRRKKQTCSAPPLSHTPSVTPNQSEMPQNQQQILQQPSQPQTPLQHQQNLNSPSPNMGLSPNARMQGPPPPYHQTARRAMPSPHPSSPNPGSLSLPSPHMVSGLASPADPSRQFPHPTVPGPRLPHPSPGATTPASSSSLHTTPLNSPKPLNGSSGPGSNSGALIKTPTTPNAASTPTGTPTSSTANALPNSGPSTPAGQCMSNRKSGKSADIQDTNSVPCTNADFNMPCPTTPSSIQGEFFCHGMHQCSQPGQKQDRCNAHHPGLCQKEPSLMPVPSPQQIQYLNAFDGQELTIQKQPNTSIRELDIMSPASMPPSMVMSTGSHSQFQSPDGASFPNTPGSCPSTLENSQDSMTGRFPSSAPPSVEGPMQRFSAPSPQMPSFEPGHRHMMPSNQMENNISRFPGVHCIEMMRLPGQVVMPHSNVDDSTVRFPGQTQGPLYGSGPGNCIESMSRYPGSATEAIQRFRGPSPHGSNSIDMMHSRFMNSSPHLPIDNMSQSTQFGSMRPESMPVMPSHSYPSPAQTMTSNSNPCTGASFGVESNMSHSHLQNLQKMTPPFENITGNKPSDVISPMATCPSNPSLNNPSNTGLTPFGTASPMTPSSQVGPSQRLTHFDPIASMAAMSESTGPLVTTSTSAQNHPNMIASNMNMTNIQSGNANGMNQPNIVNFHSNMQPMQGMLQSSNAIPSQHAQYTMPNQMTHNINCGPQTVNNTYVNATMNAQPLNIQNMESVATIYSTGSQVSAMNPQVPVLNQHNSCQGGANTISCSVTSNHPIMHTNISAKTSTVNMSASRAGPTPSFSGQPLVPRNSTPVGASVSPTMMMRATGPSPTAPFNNSTNIQVKASAPNTIQYLPARPQNASTVPNRPPTLEFLQKFAPPLTNLDNKVPTHNLQYFPNNRGSNTPTGHGAIITSSPGAMGPNMMTGQRPVNMMIGPMMRGTNPSASHAGGQMFPVGSGLPNADSSMFGRPTCPSSAQMNTQMVAMNAMGGAQGVPVFPNKQLPMSMGGIAPDATQPLPPSMGQTFNYKQPPFYGPTTADPNYAVQFHNFQQQLYATNTRGSQLNSQSSLSGQGFFGPK